MRTDDAQAAGVVGGAIAHLVLLGHIVKVQPLAVGGGHDALGPQDGAVFAGVQGCQNAVDIRLGELLGGLRAPAGEHLVGVVVMMMVMAAAAVAVMVVMMLVLVLVVIVVVMVAAAAMVMVVMIVMMVLMLIVILNSS